MKDLKKRMKRKGWKKKEIDKTVKILKKAKKHDIVRMLDLTAYWISLLIAVVGNFLISMALIPFLISLKGLQLYLVVIVIGFSFGLLFELLIRSIEHLSHHHHFYLTIFIPLIAVINIFIITITADVIAKFFFNIEIDNNEFYISIAYAIAFIAPYIIYQGFVKEK